MIRFHFLAGNKPEDHSIPPTQRRSGCSSQPASPLATGSETDALLPAAVGGCQQSRTEGTGPIHLPLFS